MKSLFSGVGPPTGLGIGKWAFVGLALFAVLLVVVLAVLLLRRAEWRRRREARERVVRTSATLGDAAELDRQAAALAAQGRFVEAVRLLYASLLIRLHRAAGKRFDPSRTPGEQLRQFRARQDFEEIRTFVRGYQRASFAGREVGRDEYERVAASRPDGATS
ncbi:MAG: DUF4129 domain-containing protein [Planctomycetota bacterium]|jgi:hypothetical protein